MAVLTKKLNLQKTGSSTVSCNIYSTTTEAGDNYMSCTVDDVNGYIPLGTTSDSNATVGRVEKSGTTYAIKSQSKPPYAEKSWTTAGTYTFTVPAGITRMRVAVCGGGSSSTACGSIGETNRSKGGDGGTSSFGNLLSATGGQAYHLSVSYWTQIAEDEMRISVKRQGAGGTPNGNQGSLGVGNNYGSGYGNAVSGASGFALSFTQTTGTYGKGGDIFKGSGMSGSGSSGGYNSAYVTVTPNTTYSVVVGAGGTEDTSWVGIPAKTENGNSGFVLIAYGGDI